MANLLHTPGQGSVRKKKYLVQKYALIISCATWEICVELLDVIDIFLGIYFILPRVFAQIPDFYKDSSSTHQEALYYSTDILWRLPQNMTVTCIQSALYTVKTKVLLKKIYLYFLVSVTMFWVLRLY